MAAAAFQAALEFGHFSGTGLRPVQPPFRRLLLSRRLVVVAKAG